MSSQCINWGRRRRRWRGRDGLPLQPNAFLLGIPPPASPAPPSRLALSPPPAPCSRVPRRLPGAGRGGAAVSGQPPQVGLPRAHLRRVRAQGGGKCLQNAARRLEPEAKKAACIVRVRRAFVRLTATASASSSMRASTLKTTSPRSSRRWWGCALCGTSTPHSTTRRPARIALLSFRCRLWAGCCSAARAAPTHSARITCPRRRTW